MVEGKKNRSHLIKINRKHFVFDLKTSSELSLSLNVSEESRKLNYPLCHLRSDFGEDKINGTVDTKHQYFQVYKSWLFQYGSNLITKTNGAFR